MGVADKVMGLMTKQVTVSDDEGIRAGTTYDGIKGLRSACRAAWCRRATPASCPTAAVPWS
jgi:hypothetical protein